MDIVQLEYFRMVAVTGSITRAALMLGMSQPSLSRAMIRLERELGMPLLEHAGRRTALTAFGRAFLPRVERALSELSDGRRELADLSGAERGIVALGFLRTLGADYVPNLVRRFRSGHPSVRFALVQNRHTELREKLIDGEIRLCLTQAFTQNDERLTWIRVFDQHIVLLVPPDHRFAHATDVRLADVAAEPFVAYERGNSVRVLSDALCAAAGFTPEVTFEAQDSGSIRGFVLAGFGIAIVPDTQLNAGLPSVRIREPQAVRPIGIAHVTDRYLTAAERTFRDFVIETSPAP